jgi:5-hydroxyisourate hydrolase-like protein (transthyretin family)
VKGALASLALVVGMFFALAAAAPYAQGSACTNFLTSLLPGLFASEAKLTASSYPQALPNDGQSEAVISVTMVKDGQPLASTKVRASVTRGDGMLLLSETVTDEHGQANFAYRAGVMPQPVVVKFIAPEADAEAELKLPIAPMAYLDIELVTPEDYNKYLERQASAAQIYKLEVTAFPTQLAADGGSLAMVHAYLTTMDGKPAPGVVLQATVASGDGSVAVQEQATDQSGHFSLYFTAGRIPGSATIRIVEPSTGLTRSIDIMLVEAGPARIELFYEAPRTSGLAREGALLPCDGVTALEMVARVSDLTGRALRGVELKLEVIDMGTGRIEVVDPVSDASGQVRFTYYAGTRTGLVRLRAFAAAGLDLPAAGN